MRALGAALTFATLLMGSAHLTSLADAAELKVLSGNGARAAVRELITQFERTSGHKVSLRIEVNAELERKIKAGETFDVAILNPPVIDELIKHGKIVAGSRADSAAPARHGGARRCA